MQCRIQPTGDRPDLLQVLDVNAISNDECKKSVKPFHESHLCTLNGLGEGICSVSSKSYVKAKKKSFHYINCEISI